MEQVYIQHNGEQRKLFNLYTTKELEDKKENNSDQIKYINLKTDSLNTGANRTDWWYRNVIVKQADWCLTELQHGKINLCQSAEEGNQLRRLSMATRNNAKAWYLVSHSYNVTQEVISGLHYHVLYTNERTQVHSAQSSLVVTHPSTNRGRRAVTPVIVPLSYIPWSAQQANSN